MDRLLILIASIASAQPTGPSNAAPPAPPMAPPAVSAPTPPADSSDPVPVPARIEVLQEKALLEPPGPTRSLTFGSTVAFAGKQAVVTGPVITIEGGVDGQIATFVERDGAWVAHPDMTGVVGLASNDVTLRRLCAGPSFIATTIESKGSGGVRIACFKRDAGPAGWELDQTSIVAPIEARAGFEPSIASNGTVIACGEFGAAPGVNAEGTARQPAVRIFARGEQGGWAPTSVLTPPEANAPWYGASLAMSGDRLAIGSPAALTSTGDPSLPRGRESFVDIRRREKNDWVAEARVRGLGVTSMPGFANDVALEGDVLAVRAVEVVADDNASRVFMFRRTDEGWTPDGELLARGAISSRAFGAGLAMSDGRVLVGDTHAEQPGSKGLGVIHVFERVEDRWIQTARLIPTAPCMGQSFGSAIAVDGTQVLVGRVRSESAGAPRGGAYLFELPPRRGK